MPRVIMYLIGLFMVYRIIKNVSFLIKNSSTPLDKNKKKHEDIIEAEYKHVD